MIRLSSCFIALLLAACSTGLPTPEDLELRAATAASVSSTSVSQTASSTIVYGPVATVAHISLDPNNPAWDSTSTGPFDSIRGSSGATIIGPNNPNIAVENPDLLAPPSTDSGTTPNIKWPMSFSHNRLSVGGWGRQQNVDVLPVATEMAGVNMRLKAGAIRELHWHKTAEWAYVIKGKTQVTSVDQNGKNFVSTVSPGDLWYFPPGIPHSLQATNDDPDGSEFLLVFPSGFFSEDSTFLLTDWLSHVPAEFLAKNFQTDISAFANVPAKPLWIFQSDTLPGPDSDAPVSPDGVVPDPFSFALSSVTATQFNGGSVKIVDSSTFKVSTTIAAAEVSVEPGAIRELHWHPTEDEWTFYL